MMVVVVLASSAKTVCVAVEEVVPDGFGVTVAQLEALAKVVVLVQLDSPFSSQSFFERLIKDRSLDALHACMEG